MVGTTNDANTGGYWEVAADGGVFSFGGAPFYGSTGSIRLNAPIVGMAEASNGSGYRFVGRRRRGVQLLGAVPGVDGWGPPGPAGGGNGRFLTLAVAVVGPA